MTWNNCVDTEFLGSSGAATPGLAKGFIQHQLHLTGPLPAIQLSICPLFDSLDSMAITF